MTTRYCCVKRLELSGLEKFEGLDPQVRCPRGYAIVNVDTRGWILCGGSGRSDGLVQWRCRYGWQFGTGHLAMVIASQQAASVNSIAAWEASSDNYRKNFCQGGWFPMSNFDLIAKAIVRDLKSSGLEDFEEMDRSSFVFSVSKTLWEEVRADLRIQCSILNRGSNISSIHTVGSIRGFLEVPHNGNKQESYELENVPESTRDSSLFFDRYLKEKVNGSETGKPSIILFSMTSPRPRLKTKIFLLRDDMLLSSYLLNAQQIGYDSKDRHSFAEFNYTFDKPARLIGLPKAVLYMSYDAHDNFTILQF
ncbi:uncharacterized protein N7484_011713 [Penicillium longicatenatum]|uniref:uncharacterized protein n=1 Tax=Penicillium longicatenatum TaxID=1561947 RepID=UPI0025474FE8|nr:uncharacterized protein N7484_011713 [Penicillium longicatenatum]KAJ5631613.1 hypothetical protein N7484_011713 [Penicillium longicatenatum]